MTTNPKADHKAALETAGIAANYPREREGVKNLAAAYLDLREKAKATVPILEASLKLWEADARLWPTADKIIKPQIEALRAALGEE